MDTIALTMIENAGIYHRVSICEIMKNRKMGVGFRKLKVCTKRKNYSHSSNSERYSANGRKGRKIRKTQQNSSQDKSISLATIQTPAAIPGIAGTQDCCNNHERRPARLPLDESTEMNLFDNLFPSSDSIPAEISVKTTEALSPSSDSIPAEISVEITDALTPSSDSIPDGMSVETHEFLNRRDIARFAISDVRNNLIELGAGVYGTVYATRLPDGRPAAVKIPQFRKGQTKEDLIEELVYEATGLKSCRSKFLPKLYGLLFDNPADTNTLVGFVQEFIGEIGPDGHPRSITLWQVINQSEITLTKLEGRRISANILKGLDVLHLSERFHNDLHGNNVLLRPTPNMPTRFEGIIADLGLSICIRPEDRASSMLDWMHKDLKRASQIIHAIAVKCGDAELYFMKDIMKEEKMFQVPRSVIEMVSEMPHEIQNLFYHPSKNSTSNTYTPQCFAINFIGESDDTSSGSCSAEMSISTPFGSSLRRWILSEERQGSVHKDDIHAAEQCNTSQKCDLENVCKVKSPIALSYNESANQNENGDINIPERGNDKLPSNVAESLNQAVDPWSGKRNVLSHVVLGCLKFMDWFSKIEMIQVA